MSNPCVQKIVNIECMNYWTTKCPGYNDIMSFINQLNTFARRIHNGLSDPSTIKQEYLVDVAVLLNDLSDLADSIEPFKGDKGQRFGNKAYRVWFEQMRSRLDEFFNIHPQCSDELSVYLQESFGHFKRLDYGTGHELSFIIFMMGVYKCILAPSPADKELCKSISLDILTLFATKYLPLCRKLQIRYQLEPAGSHGVFSLDDFQFLPFVFGSSQLVGHPRLDPKNFPDEQVARENASMYMFFAAINFIHQVKKGPFAEHSNKLWNVSGVDDWSKINRGLLRMYEDEVLKKFPIVQHLMFGNNVLKWDTNTLLR